MGYYEEWLVNIFILRKSRDPLTKRHVKIFSQLIAFVVCLFLTNPVFALSVDNIRFGVHPDKTRLVLDLSQTSDFRIFTLADPYRMVIDLPDFSWNAGMVNANTQAGIRASRHGNLKPGISRIVFDMNSPVQVRSAFTLPASAGKPNRLVVDFHSVSPQLFERNKNNILGNLNVDQAPTEYTAKPNTRTASAPPPPRPNNTVKKPLIVLDPGHGGVDPGAIATNHVHEKNIVLALAKELKQQLEQTGQYRVILTRDKDVFIKLRDRVKFARQHNADLFVSLHADTLPKNKNVRGSSVYTLSETASDKQTASLAARENKADLIAGIDLNVEDEQVANILLDLATRDTMNQSKFFANTVVNHFHSNGLKTLERPHRYAGFAVLKAPDIPSILVEAGFLSNRTEAELLNSSSHRKKLAAALKKGIESYFKTVRENERT
jgi:N-acetylmuramoyl-L-alanine amidase